MVGAYTQKSIMCRDFPIGKRKLISLSEKPVASLGNFFARLLWTAKATPASRRPDVFPPSRRCNVFSGFVPLLPILFLEEQQRRCCIC